MNLENIWYFIVKIVTAVGVMFDFYLIPYLIRRGWVEGDSAATKTKKVCDICFRDVEKLRKHLKENPDV